MCIRDSNRYIGVPLYDMYTHIIYTISPKNNGNEGGSFLLANMKWNGEIPAGIKKVIRTETDFVYTLIRTPVSYTHLRAHETVLDLVCRLLLEKKNTTTTKKQKK